MSGVPVKFRCYRCNQLLGVSRAKIGATVACPKCQADLIVPDPDAAAASIPESTDAASRPVATSGLGEHGIALDFLDLRPEDIRVEAGAADELERISATIAPATPTVATLDLDLDLDLEPTYAEIELPPSEPDAEIPGPGPDRDPTPPASPQAAVAPTGDELRAIQVEAPGRASRERPPRSRDIVLPRSVVAAWSLLVLLAQGLAFVAGLLAGHYIWRVH